MREVDFVKNHGRPFFSIFMRDVPLFNKLDDLIKNTNNQRTNGERTTRGVYLLFSSKTSLFLKFGSSVFQQRAFKVDIAETLGPIFADGP